MERRLYICRPHPVIFSLPIKIIYTNMVDLCSHRHSMILKQAILMYMILNGLGGLTGCGVHGYSLSFISNRSIQYSCLILNKTFLLQLQMLLFLCFDVSVCYSWAVEEKWMTTSSMSWLVTVSYAFNTLFSNFFYYFCTQHTYLYMLCIVAVVDCIHI